MTYCASWSMCLCLSFLVDDGDGMLTTAIPNVPCNDPEHPGCGGADGAIAAVTACGKAIGEEWKPRINRQTIKVKLLCIMFCDKVWKAAQNRYSANGSNQAKKEREATNLVESLEI